MTAIKQQRIKQSQEQRRIKDTNINKLILYFTRVFFLNLFKHYENWKAIVFVHRLDLDDTTVNSFIIDRQNNCIYFYFLLNRTIEENNCLKIGNVSFAQTKSRLFPP